MVHSYEAFVYLPYRLKVKNDICLRNHMTSPWTPLEAELTLFLLVHIVSPRASYDIRGLVFDVCSANATSILSFALLPDS